MTHTHSQTQNEVDTLPLIAHWGIENGLNKPHSHTHTQPAAPTTTGFQIQIQTVAGITHWVRLKFLFQSVCLSSLTLKPRDGDKDRQQITGSLERGAGDHANNPSHFPSFIANVPKLLI